MRRIVIFALRTLGILGMLWILITLGVLFSEYQRLEIQDIVIAISFGAIGLLPFFVKSNNKNTIIENIQDIEQISAISAINEGRLPVAESTNLLLHSSEVSHLALPAFRLITKNKVVGRTGGGGGISVRIAKGVTMRTGGGSSKSIYQDVTNRYDGTVEITNQRLVFLNGRQGFECKIKDITAITINEDGFVIVQVKGTVYVLALDFPDVLIRCVNLVYSTTNN
jgi:hypothetical protein